MLFFIFLFREWKLWISIFFLTDDINTLTDQKNVINTSAECRPHINTNTSPYISTHQHAKTTQGFQHSGRRSKHPDWSTQQQSAESNASTHQCINIVINTSAHRKDRGVWETLRETVQETQRRREKDEERRREIRREQRQVQFLCGLKENMVSKASTHTTATTDTNTSTQTHHKDSCLQLTSTTLVPRDCNHLTFEKQELVNLIRRTTPARPTQAVSSGTTAATAVSIQQSNTQQLHAATIPQLKPQQLQHHLEVGGNRV